MNPLFKPYHLGDLKLSSSIVMAPLTRSRANAAGVHSDLAATYYRQRAGAGLIITEATAVSKQGSGYVNIPGIWNDEQVKGWQPITQAVHEAGGKIFMQIFHTGRIGHSSLYGEQPVAPTTKAPKGQVMAADFSMVDYEAPRMLRTDEIPGLIQQFVNGAANARKAGFDGIEIHSANGYILDQFLRGGVNERTDQYGGSVENRARLLKEIVEGAVKIWGPGRVGVRFSPLNPFNSMSDPNPMETFTYAAEMLSAFPLAYIHVIEANTSDKSNIQPGDYAVTKSIRTVFDGTIIVNGGLTKESGEELIELGIADLVCYGAPFISNPDLVERFKNNLPLTAPDSSTFYTPGPKGYTDYPAAKAAA
jgi:N-ethylmaleimide reductase